MTPANLSAVEAGEAELAALGFREFRLRHFGGTARIEVPGDQMDLLTPDAHDKLALKLEALGFARMEIDPAGFRSGNLNRGLTPDQLGRFTDPAG